MARNAYTWSRILVIVGVLGFAGVPAWAQAEWTVMVFMNGDNNLEPDAIDNFKQMAQVGSSNEINIVVQFDRIAKYAHTNPDWAQTLRFRVTKNMEPLPANAIEDIGEANMGDGNVLAAFVTWSKAKYPAKRYMLVIWDHGQGWRLFVANLLRQDRSIKRSRALAPPHTAVGLLAATAQLRTGSGAAGPQGQTAPFRSAPGDAYRSASNDETNNDVLYDREIEDSLKSTLNGTKIDLVGFDACLMSMVETSYALRDVTQFLVASEELEPGPGWQYNDWISELEANPKQDARTLARTLVLSYQKRYIDDPYWGPSTTMSALDVGKTQSLATAISAFSNALSNKLDVQLQTVLEARHAQLTYAPGYSFYHVDLDKFLEQFASRTNDADLQQKAQAARQIIADSVVANYVGKDRGGAYGSKGLAIYFPASDTEHLGDPYAEAGYEKDNTYYPVEFVQKESWADFLHAFWNRVP